MCLIMLLMIQDSSWLKSSRKHLSNILMASSPIPLPNFVLKVFFEDTHESDPWPIKISTIYLNRQWLSRVSGRDLSHHLLPNHFNWRCQRSQGLYLGSSVYQECHRPSQSPARLVFLPYQVVDHFFGRLLLAKSILS